MLLLPNLEPFADKVLCAEDPLNPPQYRIGYRSTSTQAIVTQLDIPADVIERSVLSRLLIVPRITPNGTVTADVPGQNDPIEENWLEVAPMPIAQLVIRAVAPENLRLEEAKVSDLQALQDLLEQSMSRVRAAIAAAAETI